MGQAQTVLFCGSRNWTDEGPIRVAVFGLSEGSIVVHGGARGADMMADRFARERGLHVARVDALWNTYGRRAGPIRNNAMLRLGIDFAFAFPLGEARGTKDMCARLTAANIAHVIHGVDATHWNQREGEDA